MVQYGDCPIHIGKGAFKKLKDHLKNRQNKKYGIFILVDENTGKYCLPVLLNQVSLLKNAEIIEIESGEEHKNINTCIALWNILSGKNVNRDAVLINLGGGLISDLGGFVATTFKRGIEFINIPTTVLAQADAATGGKTGVDLNLHKNEIGVFKLPSMVIIYPDFLKTLSRRDFFSGFAEIIKHALIADANYWKKIRQAQRTDEKGMLNVIRQSIVIKSTIVEKDPLEKGLRKILNFGHTIGHALESHFLGKPGVRLLHGEAVAAGIICESYISYQAKKISQVELNQITSFICSLYKHIPFKRKEEKKLIQFMQHDKKNRGADINFTLLAAIGKAEINKTCSVDVIKASFGFYHKLYQMSYV